MITPPGRLLGVDYGEVRIGLAISDPERRIASPLQTYTRRSSSIDEGFFRLLVARERVTRLVVGLPLHTSGRAGIKAQEARAFGHWLAESTELPVSFWDERFTTVEAEAALWQAGLTHQQRKQRRDRVAAQLLLQGFIDAGCPEDDRSPNDSSADHP